MKKLLSIVLILIMALSVFGSAAQAAKARDTNSGHIVYYDTSEKAKLETADEELKTDESPKDSFDCIPTVYGNFYATGSSVDATIVFRDKVLARNVTYYSIIDGLFVVTINGYTYQMPITEVVARCEAARSDNMNSEICQIKDMEEYEFYGSYSITDVIDLEREECEECENAENERIGTRRKESPAKSITASAVSPNALQQAIINRATAVVELEWTPLVSFSKWHSNLGNYLNHYIANQAYVGLPYSRPGHFNSTSEFSGKQVYIGFDCFENEEDVSTLDGFLNRVAQSGDLFNIAASTTNPNIKNGGYGALYGLDCSRFVCYCWGYGPTQDHGSAGYDSDTKCVKLTSTPYYGDLTMSDLALLLPGDAFVRASYHAILVTAVYKDGSGNVTRVETMEEVSPRAREVTYGENGDYSLTYLLNTKLKHDAGNGTPYQIYRLKDKVTFNANGGTVSPSSIGIVVGKSYGYCNNGVLPTPVRNNYVFIGWFTASEGGTQILASSPVKNNGARKLYAHWQHAPSPDGSGMICVEEG